MKIERISENQIKCTITLADLAEHQIRFSELAYGTEKARAFFQDLMEQAHEEFGFEISNNMPLMIEAVPSVSGTLVLLITKVDEPNDLEKVFPANDATNNNNASTPLPEGVPQSLEEPEGNSSSPLSGVSIFAFQHLDTVIRAARMLKGCYNGSNSLYKESETGDYFLVLAKGSEDTTPFSKICHMLNEYGVQNASSGPTLAFLEEHCKTIVEFTALQTLAQL